MSEATAQKTVLAVFLVAGSVIVWESIKKTGKALPPLNTLLKVVVLGAVLALGASLAPAAIGPLALLIGLAVVLSRYKTKGA